jgi:hypothetical protein
MDRVRLVRAHALVGVISLGLAALGACSRDANSKRDLTMNAGPYAKEVGDAVLSEKAVGLSSRRRPRWASVQGRSPPS